MLSFGVAPADSWLVSLSASLLVDFCIPLFWLGGIGEGGGQAGMPKLNCCGGKPAPRGDIAGFIKFIAPENMAGFIIIALIMPGCIIPGLCGDIPGCSGDTPPPASEEAALEFIPVICSGIG